MSGWGNYSAGIGAGFRFARFARIAVFFDGAIGRFECKSRILGAFLQIVSHYDHPGLRCPGCCAISNGKGLDVLSFEVFTLPALTCHGLHYLQCFLMAREGGLSVKTYLLRC